jgi:hypothetical protein
MSQLNVNQDFDLFGQFWLPGAQDDPTPGRLYRTTDGIRIQLFKDLRPGPSYKPVGNGTEKSWYEVIESPRVDDPITLYGHIGNRVGKITAYHCRTVDSTTDMFDKFGKYVLEPQLLVFGAHLATDDQQYVGVRVRTMDMDEWANLNGIYSSKAEDGTRSLNYRYIEAGSATLNNGAMLSVHQAMTLTGLSVRGGSVTREAWLEVVNLPATTWVEIDRQIVTPLTSLVTLCVGQVNELSGIELTVDGDEWLSVAADFIRYSGPRVGRLEHLALLADVKLTGIATWLNKVEQLGPLPPVIARFSAHQSRVKVETELLEMTTVAEGLHARLYPDERRLDEATCDDVRSRVLGSVEDMENRVGNILRGMLEHLSDPSYPSRLKGLARRIGEMAPGICGKSNKWAEEVSAARNKYAHRSAGFLEKDDVDALLTVIESLRWLLRVVLLLETGLDEDFVKAKLLDVSGYHLFRKRAIENMSKVYEV